MDALPPYWDKALPTLTLNLPDTLFSTFWLFLYFLLKINAFPMRRDLKREKKSLAKGRLELVSKYACLTIYATETDVKWVIFQCWLSQSHIGGRS